MDLTAYPPPKRPVKKTPPYAVWQHQRDRDIVADARATLHAMSQGLRMEAENNKGEK